MMEKIKYHLENFDGPLDLLLTLIQKNKVSIYDIPIVEITDQYLDAIKDIESSQLENTGEFIVMASQLLYIKFQSRRKKMMKIPEKSLLSVWRNTRSLRKRQKSCVKMSFLQDIWYFVKKKR